MKTKTKTLLCLAVLSLCFSTAYGKGKYEENLPVTVKNRTGTYDSRHYKSKEEYTKVVLSTTGAKDLRYITEPIGVTTMQPGDLMFMDTGIPNGQKDNIESHILFMTNKENEIIYYFRQGDKSTSLFSSSRYGSPLYAGKPIGDGIYNIETDIFVGKELKKTSDAESAFGMEYRIWKFGEF